ncbi:MAG: methyl-accepting chemotaxis protein [Lachnospiraceae bacterium]|nr:methyl-accepting chemotaxis protein [Lachnospiraceae bacterium]
MARNKNEMKDHKRAVVSKEEKKAAKKAVRDKAEKKIKKKKQDAKYTVQAVKDVRGNSKRSIMQTLLLGFLVPVILMVALGIVSYNTASSGILSKYKESAMSTVSAVGNYCNLVCDSISGKALELVTNSDVGNYYEKYYKKQDGDAMEAFRSAKSIISNTKSTNKYVFSCSVIPEGGSYLSTLTGGMTDNPYSDFTETSEGSFFAENASIRNKWMGYHTYLDDNMNSTPEKYALVFYQRMLKNNTVLVLDVDMSVAMEMLDQMDFGNGSIRALVSEDGRETVSVQGKEEPVEETYFIGNAFFEESKSAEETGSRDVKLNGKKYVYIYTPVGKTGAMICALIPRSNLLGQVGTIKYITIIMVILAAGAALAIGAYISMGISKTVKSMTTGLAAVAEGDLSKDFVTKREDEFKILTSSLNAMIGSMRTLMLDMKGFGTKVNELSVDVSDKTTAVSTSMGDIAVAMDEVAKGVQNQAEDTETSNEKMLDFSDNINAVTEKTGDMGTAADKAIDAVEKGKVIVQDLSSKSDTTVSLTRVLVEDISAVQQSSEEIKSFVDVINSIAGQTNLLSLNASIEAARAGEAGRGFAVVAEEIRKLADQSKESGNRIREIVENIGSTTDKTTVSAKKAEEMVNEQAAALSQTVEVFGSIHSCVGELVEGIRAITLRLKTIMEEKEMVQGSIQNISAVSEEVAASTQEVTATLGEQVSVIQSLKDEVEKLKEDAQQLNESIEKFKV